MYSSYLLLCNKLPPKHHALIKQILIMSQYGGQESGCSLLAGSSASESITKLESRPKLGLYLCEASLYQGFPGGSESKESACNAGDGGLIPELGRFPGERNGYPLQLPGEFHGQMSRVGYSPWGCIESDRT